MFSADNSTRELHDAGVDTAVVSVGATEQCGPNLPLGLDNLVAAYFARAWGETLGAYVLPTLPFNTSEEHASFRGTVTLSPATVMLALEEVVAGLRGQGFTKQVLTVGHGGSLWRGRSSSTSTAASWTRSWWTPTTGRNRSGRRPCGNRA